MEELLFHNDTVSLCLLVNRRHKTLRVIDFRAGATPAKRNFVLAAAKREGVEKVFTLVERDEVSTWTRLGFTREGSINAFYKRSDAWILGAVVAQVGPLRANARLDEDDDDDENDGDDAEPSSPASALAERTIARARRKLKDDETAIPAVKIAPVRDADLRKAVTAAARSGRALTGFETFGRDVERGAFVVTGRGGFELHASWESQACFGNSFLEILKGPSDAAEIPWTTAAVRALCDRLAQNGIVSTFCLSPADDAALAHVYLASGFRRSGVLAKHVMVKGERKDAIVWSRKLATSDA
ncbi:Hypothetical protein A7982_11539 [Minicystis rosea]|nr:Hypothetical protein A7982_11539 [Minicystis rosea]